MAGDWIKMEHCLAEKPEVVAISCELGLDEYAVVGRLHRVWCWFSSHTEDGHAPGVTSAFIDRLVAHEGFAAAMTGAGWLAQRNASLVVPNFDRHNSKSAKRRALHSARVRRSRDGLERTKSAPEKRREEKRRVTDSAAQNPSASPSAKPRRAMPLPKPREPNPVWDQVCETWGLKPDTKADRTRIGRLARDFKLKLGGEHHVEIANRRRVYECVFPNAAATPEAVLKHWDTLRADALPEGKQPAILHRGMDEDAARRMLVETGCFPVAEGKA